MGIRNNPAESNSTTMERPHMIISSESDNDDDSYSDEDQIPDGYQPIPSDPEEQESDSDEEINSTKNKPRIR